MKQAFVLLGIVLASMAGARHLVGSEAVFVGSIGAVAAMSLMIAGTFFWLWIERATPLALGMAFSWFGAGAMTGAWWLARLGLEPVRSDTWLGIILSFPIVGAVLHFAVIHRSFGLRGQGFLWPVGLAFVAAALAQVLFRVV